jgi:uncharacterized protein YndB with AHSA1/START domain
MTTKFERIYDANVADLWELWTTKAGFEEWFTPQGCTFEVPVLEVREGGAFEHVMTVTDEASIARMDRLGRPRTMRARGRFLEVRLHERLHLQFDMDFIPGIEPYPYNMIVELFPEDDRVRMVITVDHHRDPETTRMALETLTSQLIRFEEALR